MQRFLALTATLATALLAAGPSYATEPLHDQLTHGTSSGYIFPATCCWLDLPPSEALFALKRAERCSAIGGPVGSYRYQDDKLWLVELRRCSGAIPLNQVFPDLESPALAVWLSGDFTARLD